MTKLCILDKDGTLVRPKSGNEFAQHPEDQELLPGVEEAIARLVSDGWTLAIASNQGGVAVRECKPKNVFSGYIKGTKIKSIIDGTDFKGEYTKFILSNDRRVVVRNHKTVKVQHKTLGDAIAEMRYAMQLTGMNTAYFCPDFQGVDCWFVEPNDCLKLDCSQFRGTYRKPNPGMLKIAIAMTQWHPSDFQDGELKPDRFLMIGDRPEDQQAAIAAGIPFKWAEDWRNND